MSGPQLAAGASQTRCNPVCQLFLNGFGKKSRYSLTNFASLYAPGDAKALNYTIRLLDAAGSEVYADDITVPPFGTADYSPAERFSGELPELGLFVTELGELPEGAFAGFGMLRPYFYALYHDSGMQSAAVVHPQTTFLSNAPAGASWQSSLVMPVAGLERIELFQINPSDETRATSVSVCRLDGTQLATSTAEMTAQSVRRIEWATAEFARETGPYVCIGSAAMTAPNAKPLLFQHRAGGFTAAHC